jgi:tetratricopeptide (TPR) repeat protein
MRSARAARRLRGMPSTDHPQAALDQVVARRRLGEELLLEGDRIGARRALLSALAAADALGQDDLEPARVQIALGEAAVLIGDFAEARDRYARASSRLSGEAGRACAVRARLERGVGALSLAQGAVTAAEVHAHRALSIDVAARGPVSREAAADRRLLGAVRSAAGDDAEALVLLERAVAELTAAVGADHPETCDAHAALGAALHRAGLLPRAAHAYAAAVAGRPAGHPGLAPALLGLARLAGDPGHARALATRAIGVLEGRVAGGHPDLRAARRLAAAQPVVARAPESSRRPPRLSFP